MQVYLFKEQSTCDVEGQRAAKLKCRNKNILEIKNEKLLSSKLYKFGPFTASLLP